MHHPQCPRVSFWTQNLEAKKMVLGWLVASSDLSSSTQNLAHTKQRLSPGRPAKHKYSYKAEKLEGVGLCSSGTSVSQEDPGHYRVQGKGFLGSRIWNKNPFPGPVEYESAKGRFRRRTEHRPTTTWYGYITYIGMGMLLSIPR